MGSAFYLKDLLVPLSSQTLSALQAAGSAIHAADAELKTSVQDLSDRVKTAMLDNPFDIGNDNLFESWKTLARLSQAVAQAETEFARIYNAAANVAAPARTGVSAMPKLAAPKKKGKTTEALAVVTEVEATDAAIKKTTKKGKTAAAKKKTKRPLGGNTAKVLARLQEILNTGEFVKLNRTAVAADVGIPKGSIGASIVKLLQMGQLIEDASGSFKLVSPKATAE